MHFSKQIFSSILFLFFSCSINKTIHIEQLDTNSIKEFYIRKNISIENVLIIKDDISYVKLQKLNLNEIPKVFIFDKNGLMIDYHQENYCNEDPYLFLKNIKKDIVFKYKDVIKLDDYTDCFIKIPNENNTILFNINKSKINVFINDAVYVDKIGINKVGHKFYRIEKSELFDIYITNIDLQKNWKIKNISL